MINLEKKLIFSKKNYFFFEICKKKLLATWTKYNQSPKKWG